VSGVGPMAVLSAVHRKLLPRRPWVWTTAARFYCRHAQLVGQCYGEEPEVFFTSLRVAPPEDLLGS
jgi:hypothetical protein